MTILNATVTPSVAYLSQDTFITGGFGPGYSTPAGVGEIAGKIADAGTTPEFLVCQIGWSPSLGGCRGYAYSFAEDFRSVRIDSGGHSVSPPPDPEDAGYADLYRAWNLAAGGVQVERFHALLARNQHAAYQRGCFRTGSGIGGELHLARVHRNGIDLRVIHRFDDGRTSNSFGDAGPLQPEQG